MTVEELGVVLLSANRTKSCTSYRYYSGIQAEFDFDSVESAKAFADSIKAEHRTVVTDGSTVIVQLAK